jgi:hypothetical protein
MTNIERVLSEASYSSITRKIDWKFVSILCLPLLLILLNDRWLLSFIVANFVDTWIYLGYFLDLKQHLIVFPKAYFGSRLPWILPGFLTHQLLSPWIGNYILHFGFFGTAVASLYLILKHVLGRYTAFLTTILMGCHFYFLEAVGSDYIDGAALTYFLLTLLMLTNLANSRHMSLRVCFAGIFYSCTIFTQLFLINYTPFILLYYFFMNRVGVGRLRSLLFFTLGFIGITLLFCTVNYFLNGRFWFFKYLIKWTISFAGEKSPYWVPMTTWWKTARWLLLPAITFLGSLATLIFYRKIRLLPQFRTILFFQMLFILTLALHFYWDIKRHQQVLSAQFYTSYFLPLLFMALGSQISIILNMMDRRRFYQILILVLLISLAPYFTPLAHQILQLNFNPMLWPIVLGVLGISAAILKSPHFKQIGLILTVSSMALISLTSTIAWSQTGDRSARKNSFLAVVQSVKAIQSMDPENKSRFWYNDQEPLGTLYRSVASTYLWAYRLISEEFPQLKGKAFSSYQVALNDQIFILSQNENILEKANQSLAQVGLKGKLIEERLIQEGPIKYKLTYIKINSV